MSPPLSFLGAYKNSGNKLDFKKSMSIFVFKPAFKNITVHKKQKKIHWILCYDSKVIFIGTYPSSNGTALKTDASLCILGYLPTTL